MEHADGKRRLVPAFGQSASRPSVGAGVPTARSFRRVLPPCCAFASAQIKSFPTADAPDAERQTGRCCRRAGILVPGKRKTQQSRTPLPKRSGFAVPLVRCFVLLRSLRFCLLVFQLGFQEQVDILRKGSVILLCPFAQLRQQIPVYRDADFLFQWFHMITRCQYSRTMRKTLDK